ncbi:MAG: hypothetical protein RR406_00035 [Bacilli bacterium]
MKKDKVYLCDEDCSLSKSYNCCISCSRYTSCNDVCESLSGCGTKCSENRMSIKEEIKDNSTSLKVTEGALRPRAIASPESLDLLKANMEKAEESVKTDKLLEIECILRNCTKEELIYDLISDKAIKLYDLKIK